MSIKPTTCIVTMEFGHLTQETFSEFGHFMNFGIFRNLPEWFTRNDFPRS